MISDQQLYLFRSLFRGREDVFAIRWEKGGKSGYAPARHFDPYFHRTHKIQGKVSPDRAYLPFTDTDLQKHLEGQQFLGIYPLLADHTSWFIAADFDEENWADSTRKLVEVCARYQIYAYLERSRSGNGGHVWIFFDQAYPARKSRSILLNLLETAELISRFDKNSGFDRLFPNQDSLSGKGLGNLIALPFFPPLMASGNTCFIDPASQAPFPDQWAFLEAIKRTPVQVLDRVFDAFSRTAPSIPGKLEIRLSNTIRIPKAAIPPELEAFLKDDLNFANSEFYIRQKSGRNTFGVPRFYKAWKDIGLDLEIPRGFIGKLLRFCREQELEFTFSDERKKSAPVTFPQSIELREFQMPALQASRKKDFGIIVAPPGSGKTIIALKIAEEKQQPTLIIVHRKQLMEQWRERISSFLGIPLHEIATFGNKRKGQPKITLATIQGLSRKINSNAFEELTDAFGLIIVDECHHVPAESFQIVLSSLRTYYIYGLTATPFRKFSDGKLMFLFLGDVIAEILPPPDQFESRLKVIIRNTGFDVPYDPKTDTFETISQMLIHDTARNMLITDDVRKELNTGKRAIILTERKEHIDTLAHFLKHHYEVLTLSGDDSTNARKEKWNILAEGRYQALITTGQLLGEGTDLVNAQCLFLAYPFSFKGKLIQYIGRVQRSGKVPLVFDYRDEKVAYLNRLFPKRNAFYRQLDKQNLLLSDPQESPGQEKNVVLVERIVRIPWDKLDFQFGALSFALNIPEMNDDLIFELEHMGIRPEFEVLKPYFAKVLKMKELVFTITAEYQYGKLIAQSVLSEDANRINQGLIDSLKFQFATKPIISSVIPGLPSENEEKIRKTYGSAELLLKMALQNPKARHFLHLRYLADKHAAEMEKIRFMLQPFSFIFLLRGETHFHFVLETYDTKEATYLWSIERKNLLEGIQQVMVELETIRLKGRQEFLKLSPANFYRIVHDYSEPKKGFIQWKGSLEERLT